VEQCEQRPEGINVTDRQTTLRKKYVGIGKIAFIARTISPKNCGDSSALAARGRLGYYEDLSIYSA